MRHQVLAAVGLAAAALLSGCLSDRLPAELSRQQVCEAHHSNNAMERDRCRLPPEAQRGPVPDARPEDLPIKTKQPGE
jgi:hypothetical protein